jgi:DNA-directed RNA polymerase subunit M/transcription elongation factor TFIIS
MPVGDESCRERLPFRLRGTRRSACARPWLYDIFVLGDHEGDRPVTFDVQKFIEELSPELQAEALNCSSAEELASFARCHRIPLPDDALDAIAGGAGQGAGVSPWALVCPRCGSSNVVALAGNLGSASRPNRECMECGWKWHATAGTGTR